MIYGSVCSGIESASVAWHPLGWQPAFFSEIDDYPRAVLSHRFTEVPLHGDFTTIEAGQYRPIELLVGGTPCQDFSIAGRRSGLRGARGNLTLEYCLLAERLRPRWLVWENVPGVLSSNGGRDFGAFLGLLGKLGYGFAWRVLDAQYVRVDGYPRAVPQRRERVFLVGYLGDWRASAAVLFEPQGMRGGHPPRREAGKGAPRAAGGGPDGGRIAGAVISKWAKGSGGPAGDEAYNLVAEPTFAIQERAVSENPDAGPQGKGFQPDLAYTLEARHHVQAVAFQSKASPCNSMNPGVIAPTLDKGKADGIATHVGHVVRRLSPRECERLMGFPDGWTDVPWRGRPGSPDSRRYKALGNSKCVNVVRWIGLRIEMVEQVRRELGIATEAA